ncbi:MAG TPA: hypothetical protein VFE62_15025 [Gemmataceae bacterium]|nr:hypothetical protein [Gemmataceae bacterium]
MMGRGLSKLQRFILVEASRRERLHHADVLYHFFKFPLGKSFTAVNAAMDYRVGPVTMTSAGTPSTWGTGGTLRAAGGQRFDPDAIGRSKYNSAQASISRACARLEARGLVKRVTGLYSHWAGVEITDKGREFVTVM